MGGDGGGGWLDGEVGLEESLMVCKGPTIVTRPLAPAEMCVRARAGVDSSAEDHGLLHTSKGI